MRKFGADRRWPFAEGSGATIGLFTAILATAVFLWFRFTTVATGLFLILSTLLWLLMLYFFRDPNRAIAPAPGVVVGPGDGEVVVIAREQEGRYLQSERIRISMFLNITDVHVQRVPLGGTVTMVDHQPGKFLQAFRPEASEVNEFIAMCIETPYGPILLKQIAGILARRCVNWARPQDEVATGQRFGLIKFGSRLDLFLPPDATLLVAVGDRIVGGQTAVARLHPPTPRME